MNTKQLRIKYHNEWPAKFLFPAEERFAAEMRSHGLDQCFVAAPLKYSADRQFQHYLGYLMDALDMLPLRPDFAFDHLWRALDSEFFLVQKEIGKRGASRFDGFVDRVLGTPNAATPFLDYLPLIPFQTCEYSAKRVIQASVERDNNARILFGRAKASIGDDLVSRLVARYPPAANDKPLPTDQRKAGRLLRKMFEGKAIVLDDHSFSIGNREKANFLIKVVLANSRNERFHGGVFPPFRSSSAKLSTYAHAYYLLHISYALLLEVFLYRGYAVITAEEVKAAIHKNASMFKLVFSEAR